MQKLMKMVHKNEKGFTLVELMVVVVIIGILVAIAIPLYGTITRNAERRSVEANLRTIDGAIVMLQAAEGVGTAATPGNAGNLVGNFLAEWPVGPGEAVYTIIDTEAADPATDPIWRAAVTGNAGGMDFSTGGDTLETLPWGTN